MELKELKSEYDKLVVKYKLPSFKELNEAFEIDRIERDTDCVLREVRKIMMDKIIGYVRFMEMMINPSQAPPMFMLFLKNVDGDERKTIEKVYKSFVELELHSLKLEIDYSEDEEAKAIKNILNIWNNTKGDLRASIGIMEKNWNSASVKKEKGYFG